MEDGQQGLLLHTTTNSTVEIRQHVREQKEECTRGRQSIKHWSISNLTRLGAGAPLKALAAWLPGSLAPAASTAVAAAAAAVAGGRAPTLVFMTGTKCGAWAELHKTHKNEG